MLTTLLGENQYRNIFNTLISEVNKAFFDTSEIKAKFDEKDLNKNGYIEKEEIMKEYVDNAKKDIEAEEKIIKELNERKEKVSEDEKQRIEDEIKDRKGYIETSRNYINDKEAQVKEAEEVIKKYDLNKDGKISLAEFIKFEQVLVTQRIEYGNKKPKEVTGRRAYLLPGAFTPLSEVIQKVIEHLTNFIKSPNLENIKEQLKENMDNEEYMKDFKKDPRDFIIRHLYIMEGNTHICGIRVKDKSDSFNYLSYLLIYADCANLWKNPEFLEKAFSKPEEIIPKYSLLFDYFKKILELGGSSS